MNFFYPIALFLLFVYLLQKIWRWPNHYKRFAYLPEETILLHLPKIRRRVYCWGRYGLRIMEERLDLLITTQRLLFMQRGWITQIVDFREQTHVPSFRGPYYQVPKTQILWQSHPQGEMILKISFSSLGRISFFEIFDLPQEKLTSLFIP
ncbi:MAG: hypothetical protein AABZ60_25290 [Planctomycetota bacterium]